MLKNYFKSICNTYISEILVPLKLFSRYFLTRSDQYNLIPIPVASSLLPSVSLSLFFYPFLWQCCSAHKAEILETVALKFIHTPLSLPYMGQSGANPQCSGSSVCSRKQFRNDLFLNFLYSCLFPSSDHFIIVSGSTSSQINANVILGR